MELLRTLRCVGYANLEPPMPVVGVQVRELAHGTAREFTAPLDTGFAGYLMLPEKEYDELSTTEVARDQFGEYRTMAGPVVTRRARVKIRVGETDLESFIETPLYGGGTLLLGRRIINELDIALLGTEGRACQVAATRERQG